MTKTWLAGLLVAAVIVTYFQSSKDAGEISRNDGISIKDYQQARKLFWQHVYPIDGETLYCGRKFDTDKRAGINIEHVFPMSWVTNALKCGKRKQCRAADASFNRIEGDLHNLYPSRSDVNQDRSSFRFAEVAGESRKYGSACDLEIDFRARSVEPAPAVRGDIARSMFYMAYTYRDYGLELFTKQAKTLLDWHQNDPPDGAEERRNGIIEKIQGTRNPFIDDPKLIEVLIKSGQL